MPTPTTEGAKVVAPSEYQALMQAAFAHIHPPGDWKGPINCLVPWGRPACT